MRRWLSRIWHGLWCSGYIVTDRTEWCRHPAHNDGRVSDG